MPVMRSVLALSTGEWLALGAPAIGAASALLGVAANLLLGGARAERDRKRALHARALEAITAYGETPYRIRRRAPGPEYRAALSDDLSRVKAEIDVCRVLLAADGDDRISRAYDELYELARRTVGTQAHLAWKADLVVADEGMNMGEVFRSLAEFQAARDAFANDLRRATLARRKRLARRLTVRRRSRKKMEGPGYPPIQDLPAPVAARGLSAGGGRAIANDTRPAEPMSPGLDDGPRTGL